jgi:Domain of unknown function (DUF4349)
METPDRNDQLAEDLRALRPTPHPQFAAELDQRAAAGFPRRSRLRWPSFNRLRAIPRWRLLSAGAVALLAIVVATAVIDTKDESPSGGGSFLSLYDPSDSDVEESAPPEEASAEEAQPLSGDSYAAAPNFDGGGSAANARFGNRAVERSAELVLGADPDDVADDSAQVFDVVQAHNGIVMNSSTNQGEAGEAGAHFELRIPSAKLSDALAALSAIDDVRSRRETTDDITAPTVKVGELLQDSKARIDSLLGQLAEAGTESEREAVEAELRQERRHRARLRSQLQQLQRRADFSLVLLEIETSEVRESSADSGAWGVDDALDDAGKILAVAAAVAVVALAILGPIALIALLAWLAHRVWVRRQRHRVLS